MPATMNMLSVNQIDASGVAVRRMAAPARDRLAEDKAMLRTAAELTRDLLKPRPAIYWTDLAAIALGDPFQPDHVSRRPAPLRG